MDLKRNLYILQEILSYRQSPREWMTGKKTKITGTQS